MDSGVAGCVEFRSARREAWSGVFVLSISQLCCWLWSSFLWGVVWVASDVHRAGPQGGPSRGAAVGGSSLPGMRGVVVVAIFGRGEFIPYFLFFFPLFFFGSSLGSFVHFFWVFPCRVGVGGGVVVCLVGAHQPKW